MANIGADLIQGFAYFVGPLGEPLIEHQRDVRKVSTIARTLILRPAANWS